MTGMIMYKQPGPQSPVEASTSSLGVLSIRHGKYRAMIVALWK
jgi:hypothetical protein